MPRLNHFCLHLLLNVVQSSFPDRFFSKLEFIQCFDYPILTSVVLFCVLNSKFGHLNFFTWFCLFGQGVTHLYLSPSLRIFAVKMFSLDFDSRSTWTLKTKILKFVFQKSLTWGHNNTTANGLLLNVKKKVWFVSCGCLLWTQDFSFLFALLFQNLLKATFEQHNQEKEHTSDKCYMYHLQGKLGGWEFHPVLWCWGKK